MSSAIYEQTTITRDELFESLGEVDPYVIAHAINRTQKRGQAHFINQADRAF